MKTIDKAAQILNPFVKAISGRNGILSDFYMDCFILGTVFNKNKFMSMPSRSVGAPFEITNANKKKQGVTIVDVGAPTSDQRDFSLQRLSGQVLIYGYTGTSGTPLTLKVTVNPSPEKRIGHIECVSFKRTGGVLEFPGAAQEMSDGTARQVTYAGFGKDIDDIRVVMANTSYEKDDHVIRLSMSASSEMIRLRLFIRQDNPLLLCTWEQGYSKRRLS